MRAELARRTKDAEPPDEGATQAYRSRLAESAAKFYHVVRDYRARDDVLQHHPEAAIAVGHLLLADQAWEPAIALYTRLITDDEANATLLSQRGVAHLGAEQWDLGHADWLRAVGEEPALARDAFDEFKHVNRWKEAALFGLLLMEQDPQNSLLWLEVALSVVLSEDEQAYGKFCRRVVELAGQNPSPQAAERAIKACLLRAGAIDLAALPGDRLARSLDEETPEKRLLPWFWGARALLALRSGDAESAKNFLTQPEAYHGNHLGRAMNLAILALAQHERKHSGEERKTLDEASQLITRLKEIQNNQGDHDLLITEILLREAESTIN
ncbi:MAG: hypothetical protein EA424_21970 [Planctomycetaceae bacterium]|nr:MAG: hypothetical protein EA424_21970 [Planctomycetaceae bacterium]